MTCVSGSSKDELLGLVGDYEGLVVRSETKVTAEVIAAGTRLQVIGRAGVGVDNIDVDAATAAWHRGRERPRGDTIAVAEHTRPHHRGRAQHSPGGGALREVAGSARSTWGSRFGKTLRHPRTRGASAPRWPAGAGLRDGDHRLRPLRLGESGQRMGVRLVDFPTLLSSSDFLTIHVPATPRPMACIAAAQSSRR